MIERLLDSESIALKRTCATGVPLAAREALVAIDCSIRRRSRAHRSVWSEERKEERLSGRSTGISADAVATPGTDRIETHACKLRTLSLQPSKKPVDAQQP